MKDLDYYLQLEYPFRVEQDPEGGFVAFIPELPGCYSSGNTKQEAVSRLKESKGAWLESYYAVHHKAPEPDTPDVFSGRILLRLPKYLHKRLHEAARDEGVSVNQYLVALLAEGVSRTRFERIQTEMPGSKMTEVKREMESGGLHIGERTAGFQKAIRRPQRNRSGKRRGKSLAPLK